MVSAGLLSEPTTRCITTHFDLRRFTISADISSYSDAWQTQDDQQAAARQRSSELGAAAPSRTGAAIVSALVAATGARAVVEVGTGTGVSGLAIFGGMADDGVLTTIDADGNHQSAAKAAFSAANIDPGRARLITGVPSEVLPRLTDAAYDAVVINDLAADPGAYLDQALRLLRVGGVVVLANVLGNDRAAADPIQRDPRTTALRELGESVKANDNLTAALLPLDDGLLVAVKRA